MHQAEKSKQVRSLFSFSAFHFLDDGFSDSLYLLLPFISAELNLSFSQVGFLKGVSSSMSLLQFPLSLLGERIGELTVIVAGTFGLASGFLIMSKVFTFPGILLSLIFAKGTAAGQHGLSSSILSRVFEVSGRRTAMGTYNFFGDMGKVCLPFLVAVMISLWDWRQAVFLLSIGGLAAGGLLWSLVRREREVYLLPPPHGESILKESGWGIRDRTSFSALLTIGVIDISTRAALLTFLPFLLLQKGIPGTQVSFALTLIFAGGAVGKFICGVLAEWLGIIPMVIGTEILTAAGILSLAYSPTSVIWIILPFIGIVLNGTSSVLYATVAEIISPQSRSRGYGLYYAVTLGCGAISPIFFGFIADFFGLALTIISTALLVLFTLPLSRYLKRADIP
ncbi:MAG: MFS transporter [Syntrophaceae bacterium]|nr:MFS transporter [Syntrophaceae bacterium]